MDDDSSSDLSSDLSSTRSMSPPQDYPSPVSSQEQDPQILDINSSKRHTLDDTESPAAKKRRATEPKPRTTEHLDLSQGMKEQQSQMDILLKVLRKRRKIVVIAGAGISVSAGSKFRESHFRRVAIDHIIVPDFRSSTGLFTTLRSEHKLKASGKHLFDASVYQTDSSTSSFHDMVRSLSHLVSAAEPTAFHQMLSTLGHEGRLLRLYTQNVDGIDVALPALETSVPLGTKGPWPRTVQLHGGLEKMVCSKCNHLSDFEPLLFDGPEPPLCKVCIETDKVRTDHAGKRSHGIGKLRPRIVLYNEHNPDEEAIGAVVGADLRSRPDAVIVVGTSMKIPGVRRIVREMCSVVRGRRDGLAIWINRDAPPPGKEFEDCWDLVVKGASDKVAHQWSEANRGYMDCTDSEVERARQKAGDLQVIINGQHQKVRDHGIHTPSASPHPKPAKIFLKIKVLPLVAGKPPTNSSKQPRKRGTTSKQDKVNMNSTKSSAKQTAKRSTLKKPAMLANQQSINKSFKTTKPYGETKKTSTVKFPRKDGGEAAPHTPMALLSPSAARNNGSVQKSGTTMFLDFPNLHKPPNISINSTEQCGSYDRRNRETVSPTGSIPQDMIRDNILN
ncbi:hypothetical protein MMC26_004060 [Xylographa opegraphella]|nr:hypothetical protein [Xylographa opegraphella]